MKKLKGYFIFICIALLGLTSTVNAYVGTYDEKKCNYGATHCVYSDTYLREVAAGSSTYYFQQKRANYNGSGFTLGAEWSDPSFVCSSSRSNISISQDTSDCTAQPGKSYSKSGEYYCLVRYNITCSAIPTTTTTTTTRAKTTAAPTAAPTQKPSGGGGGQTKTKKTQPTQTQGPTVPTTEIITEPVTEPPSNNTNIKLVLINKVSLNYKSSRTEYNFNVAYGIKNVSVDVELEDSKATYVVEGNTNFDDEKPVEDITITVTAADGETQKVITVHAEKFKPSETDCTLANIYIKDYSLNYDKNTFEYTLTLGKDVTSLDIDTIKQYDNQMVNVTGNEKLKNKSKILVEVESPNGDICKYEIKIKKNTSVLKYFIIILVLLISLGVAGYFLYRYINKSNGLYKYE